MQFHVLASGSTGNAVYLEMDGAKILVDAGISARRIKNALSSIGTNVEDLDGILITHEHRDHIGGIATLTKKYRLPVYARPATWNSMYCLADIPDECRCELGDSLDIGPVKIEPFSISHDAADPVGYNLFQGGFKCSVATDLGFVTDGVKKALSLSDVMVFESNHDLDMLKNGSYPWHLKKRIMSNRGHLSNYDAGWTLARLERQNSTKVFLAHMSKENNRPEIAERTVSEILTEQGCASEIELKLTFPDQISSLKWSPEE
jgi:phosphoribosyl 1,2-cyclic phosphodiesterase